MVSFFLWWEIMQPIAVPMVMDRAFISVNFAVVQIDWLEAMSRWNTGRLDLRA